MQSDKDKTEYVYIQNKVWKIPVVSVSLSLDKRSETKGPSALPHEKNTKGNAITNWDYYTKYVPPTTIETLENNSIGIVQVVEKAKPFEKERIPTNSISEVSIPTPPSDKKKSSSYRRPLKTVLQEGPGLATTVTHSYS